MQKKTQTQTFSTAANKFSLLLLFSIMQRTLALNILSKKKVKIRLLTNIEYNSGLVLVVNPDDAILHFIVKRYKVGREFSLPRRKSLTNLLPFWKLLPLNFAINEGS